MLVVDLYIRVSTEEQANKGYSLRYQEEALRNYCEVKGILIHKIVIEDFSAKSFKRPQWITDFESLNEAFISHNAAVQILNGNIL